MSKAQLVVTLLDTDTVAFVGLVDWPVSSFSLAQTLSTTSVIGSSGRRPSRSLAFERSSSTLEASFGESSGATLRQTKTPSAGYFE